MKCVLFQHGFPLPAGDWGSRRSKAKGCEVQVNKSVEGIHWDKAELCVYCSDKSISGCLAGTWVSQGGWPGWISIRQSPRPQGNIQARIKYEIQLPIISLLENILPFLPTDSFPTKFLYPLLTVPFIHISSDMRSTGSPSSPRSPRPRSRTRSSVPRWTSTGCGTRTCWPPSATAWTPWRWRAGWSATPWPAPRSGKPTGK